MAVASRFFARAGLQTLLDVLAGRGYRCAGPRVKDGAIVFDELNSVDALPRGMEDVQAPGRYRLRPAGHERYFAWANGPQALKPLLFAPREILWRADRDADGRINFSYDPPRSRPLAVIGVRACDLAALRIHDQLFLDRGDPYYSVRRAGLFLVAINCTHPASTCFCASTGDGPEARDGFDLALTELDDGFVAHAGSDAGASVLSELQTVEASEEQMRQTREIVANAAAMQTRAVPGRHLREPLFANLEHPRWDDVATRCLSCGNCTMVCPTCFCHAQIETPALDAGSSVHTREWDSCFTQGHSHIHGYTVRPDTRTRYRQWLTHKLGSWHEQFGRSGCVGCGRCITWCPTGIDITEEATAICGKEP